MHTHWTLLNCLRVSLDRTLIVIMTSFRFLFCTLFTYATILFSVRPTSSSVIMSSSVAAMDVRPSFPSQLLIPAPSPPLVTAHNLSVSPLAAGITAALLLVLAAVAVVVVGLLGVRRRCRRKATNITAENTSW